MQLISTGILILVLYVMTVTFWLLIITVSAWRFQKKILSIQFQPIIAVVVPAHDEALQIADVIASVQKCRYPEDRRKIVVIADNCTDDTAARARQAGAVVVERNEPENRGKGQALDWFVRIHLTGLGDVEMVAIVDADTDVHPDFLTEIGQSMAPDVQAVQGFYGVRNWRANWRTALASAALTVFHHVRPAGRVGLGGSAGLKGNGMAFRKTFLIHYGWPAHSIVEDLEFGLILAQDGIRVHYNPDAVVLAEMAQNSRQSETQRKRWEGGRIRMMMQFAPKMLWAFLMSFIRCQPQTRQILYLDSLMELVTPPLGALVLMQFLILAGSSLMWPSAKVLLVFAVVADMVYVFSGLLLRHAPVYVWGCLLAAPLFLAWKIPVYLHMLLTRRQTDWTRTRRNREMKAD
ncbi:MAG: glycosyltransferase family 2 protein [Desulfatirhabdiaceae bacterium]